MKTPQTATPRLITAIAAGTLLLAACGNSTNSVAEADVATTPPGAAAPATAAPAADTPATVAPATAAPATAAPDLAAAVPAALVGASTIDGAAFDAASLAGRPTIAWFWAPWCSICRAEAPEINKAVAAYGDQVNFVGIAGLGAPSEMADFVADTGTQGFVHLNDSTGAIWASYGIFTQPAFAFIGSDGQVETFLGSLSTEDLAEIITQMLAA